jgi:hypothetical protein
MPERAWWLAGGLATAITFAAGAEAADETAIGEPVERHGIEVGAAYLDAIEMDPAPAVPMGDDVIHLECDVAATADNAHGFPEGAWVPYLTCAYEIEKVGAEWRDVGVMLPMSAQDGPHYANNVPLDGAGEYRVTYHVSPPSVRGFYRHADDATGVEPWWQPFEVSWTFDYRAGG